MTIKLEPIEDDNGDLFTIEEFKDCCACGGFVDYDGYGNFATSTHYLMSVDVYPSRLMNGNTKIPAWATHILWYNR